MSLLFAQCYSYSVRRKRSRRQTFKSEDVSSSPTKLPFFLNTWEESFWFPVLRFVSFTVAPICFFGLAVAALFVRGTVIPSVRYSICFSVVIRDYFWFELSFSQQHPCFHDFFASISALFFTFFFSFQAGILLVFYLLFRSLYCCYYYFLWLGCCCVIRTLYADTR